MPEPFRELALVGTARREPPRPVPRPGGAPGWPPSQPAFGADWVRGMGMATGLDPARGARARLALAGLAAAGAIALAVVIAALL